jgi:endonuclease YncB( thermonuclease family)
MFKDKFRYFWIAMAVIVGIPWIWQQIPNVGNMKSDYMKGTTPLIERNFRTVNKDCILTRKGSSNRHPIYDGDTATFDCSGEKTKVRFNCIDTPEMKQKHWGRFSRDYLRGLLPLNARVKLDVKEKDRYGRSVADVYHNGQNINLMMVHSGHANVYRKYCKDNRFIKAAKEAESAGVGIWSEPGLHQTPWLWRRRK